MELITVKAGRPYRVCLSEKHPDHPGGEAFVAGDIVATVARTPEVETRLQSGLLEETTESNTQPFAGYDDLDALTVTERMAAMGESELVVLRQYEAQHKARKSVMDWTAPVAPVGEVKHA